MEEYRLIEFGEGDYQLAILYKDADGDVYAYDTSISVGGDVEGIDREMKYISQALSKAPILIEEVRNQMDKHMDKLV